MRYVMHFMIDGQARAVAWVDGTLRAVDQASEPLAQLIADMLVECARTDGSVTGRGLLAPATVTDPLGPYIAALRLTDESWYDGGRWRPEAAWEFVSVEGDAPEFPQGEVEADGRDRVY
ncbi:MAG: hypothetical protein JSS27_12910 [Planctomycetes bacterium]|nr:hypothetical protein [Planctomycetota bacterium]